MGGPAAVGDEAQRVTPRMWLGLMALSLSAMMHGVDAMVVSVASPTISRELNTGLHQLLWITTGYMLGYAASLVAAGMLGDRYGHRRVFLVGIVGFVLSSVLVGLAGGIGTLIAWRVVQGICGGALVPSALAIIRLTFPPDRLKIAIGVFVGTFALSSAGGPALGGVVVEYAGWRWAFFINVIAGSITFVLALLLIRPTPAVGARRGLDIPGILLLAAALAAFVLGINQVATEGWTGVVPLTSFAAALVLGTLLVLRERAVTHPLLPPSLFRPRAFIAGNLLILVAGGLLFAVWFYLSLFLQNVQNASPLRTGVDLLPIALAGIFGAPLSGVLNQKLGARLPLAIGVVLSMVSFFLLSRLSIGSGYSALWPILVIIGLSMSFIVPVATEAVVSSAPQEQAGVASGIAETMGSLGPALGVAAVGTAMTFAVNHDLSAQAARAGIDPATTDRLHDGVEEIAQGANPAGLPDALSATVSRVVDQLFTDGWHTVLLGSMIAVLVLLPFVWLIASSTPARADTSSRQGGTHDAQ
ncbi:MFS transporter [Actinoplanes sp. TFC3]|uniref:MFS transporter n=1 Tax=Actinoplanes sp. TFC3 TaxID=1710355 RepID=UPI0008358A57|nr:MFS transporter [Actinoplanes sp. TFC3]